MNNYTVTRLLSGDLVLVVTSKGEYLLLTPKELAAFKENVAATYVMEAVSC